MKKAFKGVGLSLCAMLLLAGCSCKKEESDTKANINNSTETFVSGLKDGVSSIPLQNLYDDLKNATGNSVAANKLLELIADKVLSDAKWQQRYEDKIKEKLMELTKKDDYKTNGVFDEERLVKNLNMYGDFVVCQNNEYGPTYENGSIDEYMLCDYTKYVDKNLKLNVLAELLNEKYVYDKVMIDKTNILTTKKARMVEYISIGYADDTEESALITHIVDSIKELEKEDSDITLEKIASNWTDKKIQDLVDKFDKINTVDDKSGAIMSEFTNGYTQSAAVGLEKKKQEIYATSNYQKVVITSDSSDILNSTLVERILSENVISSTSNKTIKINDGYYLVAPWAGNNIDSTDLRIKDSSNSKYYIVKVDVINSDSNETMVYEAVKVLGKNTKLVGDSISYYLEQYKNDIKVYDEEIYKYLKTQYSDIFVD